MAGSVSLQKLYKPVEWIYVVQVTCREVGFLCLSHISYFVVCCRVGQVRCAYMFRVHMDEGVFLVMLTPVRVPLI